jgi:hypothetical protein
MIMKLDEIKKGIQDLTDEEKRQFFSEVIPVLCETSLTREGCRIIFEKKLPGSEDLKSFDELHALQEETRRLA